ncbi:hypothetical protein AGMMS49944_14330 [Spirochaetia bacterium]|nr:hypothetical protein AGMMS49944_14330 [Spirochaetia bacterium]
MAGRMHPVSLHRETEKPPGAGLPAQIPRQHERQTCTPPSVLVWLVGSAGEQ